MRQALHTVVNVLDGKPTHFRGQSLVEMTLTFPILILMILSLTEVGLVANNYMILMDVVRSAARDAVNFTPDVTKWDDHDTRNTQRLDCDTQAEPAYTAAEVAKTHLLVSNGRTADDYREIPRAQGIPGYLDGSDYSSYAFFDEVACQVSKGLAPLVFNDLSLTSPDPDTDNHPANPLAKDEIVVSAVSYAKIDYTTVIANPYTSGTHRTFKPATAGLTAGANYMAGPGAHNDTWVTVTARWPLANRYCNNGAGQGDLRDPFDWKRSDFVAQWNNASATNTTVDTDETPPSYLVWNGVDKMDTYTSLGAPPLLPNNKVQSQGVRGFIFTGAQRSPVDQCYGSRFTVQDIEGKLNLDPLWNPNIPNGGLVIVELFWQHHPLVLGPLFQGFTGHKEDDPVLYVWAWYPLSSVESTETPNWAH